MRWLPRLLLLSLLVFEFRIPMAWACYCLSASPVTMLEDGEPVYVGKVVRVGGFARCNSVDFEVTEAFQGVEVGDVITRDVEVGPDLTNCTFTEIPYDEGEEWLLAGEEDQVLAMCGISGTPLEHAEEDIAELRSLTDG